MRATVPMLLALALAPAPAAADFDGGMRAFEGGDFAAARSQWEAAALEGDARAQLELGKMLANGIGVSKDYITAYAWLFLAEEGGNREAGAYHRLLEQKHLPRYCQYEAQALIRDYRNGRGARLVADIDRNASRCWGHSPPR